MSVVVNVNGKRITIKVSPSTTLSKILQDVCTQEKLDPSHFTFTHNSKDVDLSLPFRLSGLSQGAKLDIKKVSAVSSSSTVNIALQLPSGERLQSSFSPSSTLHELLLFWEKEKNLPPFIDTNSKTHPTLLYMNREIEGTQALLTTTLHQLGINSGSSLLKLALKQGPSDPILEKKPENTIEQKETKLVENPKIETTSHSISTPLPIDESNNNNNNNNKNNNNINNDHNNVTFTTPPINTVPSIPPVNNVENHPSFVNNNESQTQPFSFPFEKANITSVVQTPTQTESFSFSSSSNSTSYLQTTTSATTSTSTSSTDNNSDPNSSSQTFAIPDRETNVLAPSETSSDPKQIDVPESYLNFTPTDYQLMAEMRKKQMREEQESKVLKTKAMREREKEAKAIKFSKTVIRIRFPDRIELQGTFSPHEAIESLYVFVRDALSSASEAFYLYITPPITKLTNQSSTLQSMGLVPSAVILFSWENKSSQVYPYLKPELMKTITEKSMIQFVPPNIPTDVATSTPTETNNSSSTTKMDITPASSRSSSSTTFGESRDSKDKKPSGLLPKWFVSGKKI